MTLRNSIERYIAWRRAHGAKFVTSAGLLHCFCKHVGGNLDCDAVGDAVGEAEVLSFLAGNGPLTRSRANWPSSSRPPARWRVTTPNSSTATTTESMSDKQTSGQAPTRRSESSPVQQTAGSELRCSPFIRAFSQPLTPTSTERHPAIQTTPAET